MNRANAGTLLAGRPNIQQDIVNASFVSYYQKEEALQKLRQDFNRQTAEAIAKGRRPPPLPSDLVIKRSPTDSDKDWARRLKAFEKRYTNVKQPSKLFVKDSENKAYVDAAAWRRYQGSIQHLLPSGDPSGFNSGIVPPSPYTSHLLRLRVQDPIVADGRPGGKKGVAVVARAMPPPKRPPTSADLVYFGKPRPSQGSSSMPQSVSSAPVGLPTVVATFERNAKPRIRSDGDKCQIRHCELLSSINASQTFTKAIGTPINPGLFSSFPYLSTQCQAWERYRFKKLIYHYVTKTNFQVSGSVIGCTDYDANESQPTTEQIAFTYHGCQETSPYLSCAYPLNPSRLHPGGAPKLIRQTDVPSKSSLVDYDAGTQFFFTNDGAAGGALWGKVWVEYDIELSISQSNPAGFATGGYQISNATNPATGTCLGTQSSVSNTAQLATISSTGFTSLIEGSINYQVVTTAATSVTPAQPTPDATSSLSTYVYQSSGTPTTCLQIGQWKAKVGSTLTFANTMTGGSACAVFLSLVQAYPL